MRGNIAQMMQQAQKMQENLKRAQEELGNVEVTGTSGGGMVSVTLSGRMARARGSRRIRAIRNHHRHARPELPRRNRIDHGLQITPAPRDQNSEGDVPLFHRFPQFGDGAHG